MGIQADLAAPGSALEDFSAYSGSLRLKDASCQVQNARTGAAEPPVIRVAPGSCCCGSARPTLENIVMELQLKKA